MDFKNKTVLIIGLAKTGIYTIKHLNKLGAKIIVNDIKDKEKFKSILKDLGNLSNIEYVLGSHLENLDGIDIAIISPGVPTELQFVLKLKNQGVEVIGEVELAYRLSSEPTYIGITGTNGKTTTTSLLGEIFKSDKKDTYIAGNIGNPVIGTVDTSTEESYIITELSSFQLESITYFKPKISIFLNITEDHLNRHLTLENYTKAKSNIFKNQKEEDFTILNYDDLRVRGLKELCNSKVIFFSRKEELDRGIYLDEKENIIININGKIKLLHRNEINLPGSHNLENVLAAVACAYISGISINSIKETLRVFNPVEHRQEVVKTLNGITFINDSKGTNPDATIKAIKSYESKIVLIIGGYDKNSDFNELLDMIKPKSRGLICIGETTPRIVKLANKKGFKTVVKTSSMASAVEMAYCLAEEGDIVLLSPGCASWDMYNNFEERGNDFKANVQHLK